MAHFGVLGLVTVAQPCSSEHTRKAADGTLIRMRDNRSFPWDIAALAGGVALGVVASRLLPPVMANASGAVRAKFGQDPFRKLEQDHRLVKALLRKMAEASEDSAAQRMKLLLMFKRALG